MRHYKLIGLNFSSKIVLLIVTMLLVSCDNHTVVAQDEPDNPEFDGTIVLGKSTGIKISPFLTGINTVYAHENMNTWEDGNKIRNLKNTGISALRYPEGHQVSFWDWEFPFHEPYQDFWNPEYENSLNETNLNDLKEQHKNRMLLEDYFEICRNGNIEPIVGINMFQGWKYNRTEESIQKAVGLVEYCLQQYPNITYFFLDNEAGHQPENNNHIPIDDYIQLIPSYSQAIKSVHPEAKLIPNIMRWNTVKRMIQETGQCWDVYDQHWYYGSSGRWAYFNLDEWRNEIESEVQANRITDFNNWKNLYGMSHLEFSYLEWNGPPPNLSEDSNPRSLSYAMLGLIQADQLMFFAKNEIHMATAWPLTWQPPNQDIDHSNYNRNLLDRDDSNWLSPCATIFEAFSYVQNGEILENNNDSSTGLRVLTVKREQGKGYAVLILNKSNNDQTVEIVIPNEINSVSKGKHFTEGIGPHNVSIESISPELNNGKIYQKIQGTSFVFLLVE